MWYNKYLKTCTKVRVYRAIVLATLLYGSELWITYRHSYDSKNGSTSGATARSLTYFGVTFFSTLRFLKRRRSAALMTCCWSLRCASVGHISSMEKHHLPKILLYNQLSTGYHVRDAPKKKEIQKLPENSFTACHINDCQCSNPAENRDAEN